MSQSTILSAGWLAMPASMFGELSGSHLILGDAFTIEVSCSSIPISNTRSASSTHRYSTARKSSFTSKEVNGQVGLSHPCSPPRPYDASLALVCRRSCRGCWQGSVHRYQYEHPRFYTWNTMSGHMLLQRNKITGHGLPGTVPPYCLHPRAGSVSNQ